MQRWLIVLFFIALPAFAEPQLAGEVTAVMGESVVTGETGEAGRKAVEGMQLHVGDVLKTSEGAHLHMRMVDDAEVSLRPNSSLRIVSYDYRAGVADATKIRMDLLYGTVRSVTGKGGHMAKDRFRMNTPIAAIGVRGTDFIAQADADSTLVHVASGAIVLAPFGAGCQAGSLGVCETKGAKELAADMQNMMLELNRGMTEPRLVPLISRLKIPADAQSGLQQGSPPPPDASGQVAVDAARSTLPQAPPVLPVLSHYEMVWGRWAWAPQDASLGIPLSQAMQGREVTVGNSTSALFRDNGIPITLPQSGRTEFSLRSAQVSLQQPGGSVAGLVQNGTLGVDFNSSTFSTVLNIIAPQVGQVALNAVGTVSEGGIMRSVASGSNGLVAGSLSRTGNEAGYLFALPTSGGKLSGTTLWIK